MKLLKTIISPKTHFRNLISNWMFKLNTTVSNICKSCGSETKPDEWSNYEEKLCIDCKQEDDNEGLLNDR